MTEPAQPTVPELKPASEFLVQHRPIGVFDDAKEFAHAQRVARMLALSNLMPEHFRGEENLGSVVIAVDIAFRLKLNPLLVAQQIFLIHGRPGFSAQFFIAVMNTNADFGKLRFDMRKLGKVEMAYTNKNVRQTVALDDVECIAWALEGRDQRLPDGV